MAAPASPSLSASQLAMLGALGEERTGAVGDVLLPRRRRQLPVHRDPRGRGRDPSTRRATRSSATAPSGFLGELNLLTGQTVFLTAVVTQPLRYIAVERDALRAAAVRGRAAQRPAAVDLHRAARGAADGRGHRARDRRPALVRGDDAACSTFARSNRLPFTWHDGAQAPAGAARELPLVRLPGGAELRAPSTGQVSRALGIGRELAPREEVDLLVVGGGPGRPRRRRVRRVRGPGDARRREHGARRAGRRIAPDRELPRLPGRHHRRRADEPRGHAGAQVRRAHGDAVPRGLARARQRPLRRAARGGPGDRRARRAARDRRPVPAAAGRAALRLRGPRASSTPPARPRRGCCGASRVGVVGGGNSAGQAAVWLARGGALVTLLHRRADLRETMSDYLVRDLERYGVVGPRPQRDRRAARRRRAARGGDAERRRAAAVLVPVPLPRRAAVHRLARRRRRARRRRLHPHRRRRRRRDLLETSLPGVFAAGRRPLRLDEALRDRGRRGRHGGAVRPRAACGADARARADTPSSRPPTPFPVLGRRLELCRDREHDAIPGSDPARPRPRRSPSRAARRRARGAARAVRATRRTAFAERTRRELVATGATVRRRSIESRDEPAQPTIRPDVALQAKAVVRREVERFQETDHRGWLRRRSPMYRGDAPVTLHIDDGLRPAERASAGPRWRRIDGQRVADRRRRRAVRCRAGCDRG